MLSQLLFALSDWSFNTNALSDITNLIMDGTLDLGTNTIIDGTLAGNWSFSGNNLSNIGTVATDVLTIGNIDLNATGTGTSTSGAYLVGTYSDDMDNTASDTVQEVLEDFDAELTARALPATELSIKSA